MRIAQFYVHAFGPFTDFPLNLGDSDGRLTILYGPNEAGKSSMLRAVKALLFGIPHNTPDNFVHDYGKLRVGARLLHSDGSDLVFVRRKGTKNTLLSPAEDALPDNVLDRFLGGVTDGVFSSAFGIDHEALVRGGREILEGRGDVAESLFAAGLGGISLRRILREIEEKRQLLFLQGGKKPLINALIGEYAEARKQVNNDSLSSRDWVEHSNKLTNAQRELERLGSELQQRRTEQRRLERLQAALPKVAKRKALLAEVDALDNVVVLPATFPEERRAAIQKLAAAKEEEERAELEVARLSAEIQEIIPSQPILVHEDAITEIHQRLGSHQKAMRDVTGLKAQYERALSDAAAKVAELKPGLTVERADELRLSAAQRARIADIGSQCQALVNDAERTAKELRRSENELQAALKESGELGPTRDPMALKRIITLAQRQGDLDARLRARQTDLAAEHDKARLELKRLGLWAGTLEQLEQTSFPSVESVESFELALQDLAADLKGCDRELQAAHQDVIEGDEAVYALTSAGTVPTEDELSAARQRRDQAWRLIRRAWFDGEDVGDEAKELDAGSALPDTYEKSVAESDEIADRLRREASRVAAYADLTARRLKLANLVKSLETRKCGLEEAIRQKTDAWSQLWHVVGGSPLTPKEMRAWLVKLEKLLQRGEQLRGLDSEIRQLEEAIAKHCSALRECLQNMGYEDVPEAGSLSDVLAYGEVILENVGEANRRAQDLGKSIAKLRDQIASLSNDKTVSTAKLEQWRSDWADAMGSIGLSQTALPAEANAVVGQLEELFKGLDDARRIEVRIQGIDMDARVFEADVLRLTQSIGPGIVASPVTQAASELNQRLASARKEDARLAALQKQVKQNEIALQKAKAAITTANDKLAALCRQAGCMSPDELEACEERSSGLQEARKEIESLEKDLLILGEGISIEALRAEAERVSADSLPAQIKELSAVIARLETQRESLNQEVGGEHAILRQMDGTSKAADAAEKVQDCLAGLREHVDRYVALSVCSMVLKREIQRYRSENQGPILRRASDLFATFTLGSFTGLETDFGDNDEQVLLGVRPSGEQVRVDGMSDGTCDQLYLSLRLATLEKYLETNEALPFLVDDILIRFDDDRAAATLGVLAGLAARTQVLLFTHHQWLVDLASSGTLAERTSVHRLHD